MAILVRIGIKYQIIDNIYVANNKLEACGIKIKINRLPIDIISVYRPPQIALSR